MSVNRVGSDYYMNHLQAQMLSRHNGVRHPGIIHKPPKMKPSSRKTSTKDVSMEYDEILNQLKEKFNSPSSSPSIKTMILTIAPKSWSENRLAQKFGTSRRQAKKAKQLVEVFGILTSPNPRVGRKLPPETETLVKKHFLREDISRVMPGKKDFVSIKLEDGQRTHIQKQLLMCNIDELYQKFKIEYPNVIDKIFYFKTKTMRPRWRLWNTYGVYLSPKC